MNNHPVKGSSKEDGRKSREDAQKVAEEEKAKNKGKADKRGDKGGAVLGEINDN